MKYLLGTLNRYFSKSFLLWFTIVLLSLVLVISIFEGIELIRRGIGKPEVTMGLIGEIILLKMPNHLQILVPFVVFLSTILCFWRLNQTYEIIALKSCGVSIWQLMSGFSILIGCLGIFFLIFIDPIRSAMTARVISLEDNIFGNSVSRFSVNSGGICFREKSEKIHTIVYVKNFDAKNNVFHDISFFDFQTDGRYLKRIDAKKAVLQEGSWLVENAEQWLINAPQSEKIFSYKRSTNLSVQQLHESQTPPEAVSFWGIGDFIKILEQTGINSLKYRLYQQKQIAQILSMIAMAFFAAVFCLHPERYHNTALLIISGLIAGFVIYLIQDITYAMGCAEKIPIFLAAWAPGLIILLCSILLLLNTEEV